MCDIDQSKPKKRLGSATCAGSSADYNDQRPPLLVKLVHHFISLGILCPKPFTLHDIKQNCLQVFLQHRSNYLRKATAKMPRVLQLLPYLRHVKLIIVYEVFFDLQGYLDCLSTISLVVRPLTGVMHSLHMQTNWVHSLPSYKEFLLQSTFC